MEEQTCSAGIFRATGPSGFGGLAVLLFAAAIVGGCATGRPGSVVKTDPGTVTSGAPTGDGQAVVNAAGEAGRTVGETAADVGRAVGETAGDVGRAVGETAGDVGRAVGETAGDVGRAVGETAGDVGRAVGETAGDVGRVVGESADEQHRWISLQLGDIVDRVDKMFGEPRVEDRLRIVQARLGGKAGFATGETADFGVSLRFRFPLPALQRRANLFLEYSSDTIVDNLGGVNTIQNSSAATRETEATLAAGIVKRLTDTFDFVGKVAYHGLRDYGPEASIRYERRWAPWMFYAEQEAYWRTARHWGGKTGVSLTYEVDPVSFIRILSEAKYYQDQRGTDLTTGASYRRPFFFGSVVSVDVGVQYNGYDGDPKEENVTDLEEDGDQIVGRVRMVGRVWRDWIEWEVTPGYSYLWQHQDPGVVRLDLKLTIFYEKRLSGPR
jgi:hypothetical protein